MRNVLAYCSIWRGGCNPIAIGSALAGMNTMKKFRQICGILAMN